MARSPMTRRLIGALILVAALAVTACTAASPSPSSGAPSASASAEPTTEPSAAPTTVPSAPASAAPSDEPTESLPPFACTPSVAVPATVGHTQITDVRVGGHDGYDRVVIEFSDGIPQTVIEAVLPPFYQDASGLPLEVNGTAFLKVTMHGATKLGAGGGITYTGPQEFEPGLSQLVHLIEGGDFEAVSTWYLGLDGGGCTRVLTLAAPNRLVIDVEH